MAKETDPLIYKSPNADEALNLVSSKITRYVTEVGHFEKMVHRYGSPGDTTEFRKEIIAKRDEMVHMYKVILQDVKELKSVVHGLPKIKLEKMTDQFEQAHKEYLKFSESSIQKDRVYHPIFVEPPRNPVKEYQQSHTPQPQHYYQQNATPTQLGLNDSLQLKVYEEDPVTMAVQERNKDMAQVAQDMAMLKEVYSEVNKLVVEQGITLEQVHKNTSQADTRVEEGVTELRVAKKYTHSYRKKLIILAIIIILILVVVGVVLYIYLR